MRICHITATQCLTDMNTQRLPLDLMTVLLSNKQDHHIPPGHLMDSGIHSGPTTAQECLDSSGVIEERGTDRPQEEEEADGSDEISVAVPPPELAFGNTSEDERRDVAANETYVVVCSHDALNEAESLSAGFENSRLEVDVTQCNEESDFNLSCLSPNLYQSMYVIVDSKICDIMIQRRRLRDSVFDFFEEFVKTCKVFLVNRLSRGEHVVYDRLRTQLPECVKEYKEITVTTVQNQAELGQNQADLGQNQAELGQNQPDHGQNQLDHDQNQPDLGQNQPDLGQNQAYLEMDQEWNFFLDDRKQTDRETPTLPKRALAGREGMEHIPAEEAYVMVGSNCKMNIEKSENQTIVIKQDGTCNLVNVQIVPSTTTSKLKVVITTDPNDPDLERHLTRVIREDQEVINICLSHFDGSILAIRNGSIVIEIDVKPGEILQTKRLKCILETIFQARVASSITKGTSLKVDMDVKNVIPVSKLLDFFSEIQSEEDIHKNCIAKEKYEAVVKELRALKERLNVVTVSVVLGDITEEKSEVIVNSTNPKLILSDGAVSNDILKAAGSEIQDECRSLHESGVKVGEVAVTSGGNLSCKNIYHITLSDSWSSKKDDTEKSLENVLVKCLQTADNSGHRSISIPALGTGKLKYDPVRVAEILYDVCLSFSPSGLMEVRLVVHPSCPDVHKALIDVDGQKRKTFVRSQSSPSSFSDAKQSTKSIAGNTDFKRKIQVNWVKGDIAKQKVQAIVSSTVPMLNLSSGPLSKAVLAAAGNEIQDECKANYPQGIKAGDIAYTSGGRMSWNHVYHVTLWPWSEIHSLEKPYKDLIKECLLRAADYDEHSIAFPLLGTGGMEYPHDKVVKWISDALEEYQSNHPVSSVCQVNIVVNPKDTKSIQAVERLGKF